MIVPGCFGDLLIHSWFFIILPIIFRRFSHWENTHEFPILSHYLTMIPPYSPIIFTWFSHILSLFPIILPFFPVIFIDY